MQSLSMITIANSYQPMSAGKCTVRKMGDKYLSLDPGDQAWMSYYTGQHEGHPQGERLASEKFIVSRIVIGTAKEIIPGIWRDNHAAPRDEAQLWDILRKAYSGEFHPNTLAIAIYA